jgi:hypothetical protein
VSARPARWRFLNNPLVQIVLGAIISFAGSVYANYLFINKRAKDYEAQKAFNRLVDAMVRLDTPIDPHGLLPLAIADRADDFRFALRMKNPKYDTELFVQKAVEQSAEIRRKLNKARAEEVINAKSQEGRGEANR